MLELTNACKALPNFDTLQIVSFSLAVLPPTRECESGGCNRRGAYTERQKRVLVEQMKDVKGLAINCLKEPATVFRAGGTKKATLRVIELSSARALLRPTPRYGATLRFHLDSVKVEECEV